MKKDRLRFEDLKLTRQFLNAIEDIGFVTPTRVQQQAIPVILAGQQVIGIAPTGTGKSAAYLLPILQKLKYAQGSAPRGIILVPTKELVLQVAEQSSELAKYTDLRILPIYGGVGKQAQMAQLKSGCDLLVSTPRRIVEMNELGVFRLNKVNTFILDEADRMLDMGFLRQINRVLDLLPRKRQNLLFSATFSEKVEQLSGDFIEFPVKIEVEPSATTAETISQKYYKTPNQQTKINLLKNLLLDDETFLRIIVFCRTKKQANIVFEYLRKHTNGTVRVIHSNKDQNTRINAMNAFKSGELRILVSTDVTARGIDVSDVSHVINFEVPIVYEDYVHRVGRTGRAKKDGIAITFVNPAEVYHFKKIQKLINKRLESSPIPDSVSVPKTSDEERQEIDKAIDDQKRKENPDFKGAFHEKKHAHKSTSKKKNRKRVQHKKKKAFYNKKRGR